MIKEIKSITNLQNQNNKTVNIDNLINIIVEKLKKEILDEPDRILLDLVYKENPTQEDLDNCLNNYDIEVVGAHKALMLAYFMKMHPELKFSKYAEPRLKGLIQYFRFNNLKLISSFTKICRELNKHNINDIMILKGGAMKHLRPEFPRVMGDVDILVREADYEKAVSIAQNMGYDIDQYVHSTDLHLKGSEEGLLDIHRYIYLKTGYEKPICNDFFNRASKQKVFGLDILVPCAEDMVFISLVNLNKNLIRKTSSAGILYTLFDCGFLINSKKDFDWNIVIDNVEKTKTKYQMYLAVNFVNSIVPNFLPNNIIKERLLNKEIEDHFALLFFKRFYLKEMKAHSHALKVGDAIKSLSLFREYMSFKPKYFICKRKAVKKNLYLVKKILKLEKILV